MWLYDLAIRRREQPSGSCLMSSSNHPPNVDLKPSGPGGAADACSNPYVERMSELKRAEAKELASVAQGRIELAKKVGAKTAEDISKALQTFVQRSYRGIRELEAVKWNNAQVIAKIDDAQMRDSATEYWIRD